MPVLWMILKTAIEYILLYGIFPSFHVWLSNFKRTVTDRDKNCLRLETHTFVLYVDKEILK